MNTVAEIKAALEKLFSLKPNAKLFVFCTHRSPIFTEFDLPGSTVFVIRDDGYEGSLESLWLLSQCKHHIFTNSSYYWWGAWLAEGLHSKRCHFQHVFQTDNFTNQDCRCVQGGGNYSFVHRAG
jgi:hypothetical protein